MKGKKAIHKRSSSRGNRGQVGIGTLIVFIALVLVAAIAAGVLINTAGFLQSQAEATGEDSTSQVSDNIEVISSYGTVNDGGSIGDLRFTVTKAPGSDTVDLSDLTIELTGPDGSAIIGLSDEDPSSNTITPAAGTLDYGLDQVQAEQSGEFILSDNSDQFVILVGLGSGDGTGGDGTYGGGTSYAALGPDSEATVTITTPQGSQRSIAISVPSEVESASQGEQFSI